MMKSEAPFYVSLRYGQFPQSIFINKESFQQNFPNDKAVS